MNLQSVHESSTTFPKEILLQIFSNLNFSDFITCSQICKVWVKHTSDPIIFNKAFRHIPLSIDCIPQNLIDFVHHDSDAYLSLPLNIGELLKKKCPVFPEKRIRDTHMLVRVNINFDTLRKILIKHFKNNRDGFRLIWDCFLNNDETPMKPYWLLMLKDPHPRTLDKKIEEGLEEIRKLQEESKLAYVEPNLLEAALSIHLYFFRYKKHLFENTYTTCSKESFKCIPLVGMFSNEGLFALADLQYTTHSHTGIAPVIRL